MREMSLVFIHLFKWRSLFSSFLEGCFRSGIVTGLKGLSGFFEHTFEDVDPHAANGVGPLERPHGYMPVIDNHARDAGAIENTLDDICFERCAAIG